LTSANIVMLGKFSADAQVEIFTEDVSPIVPMLTGGVGQDIQVDPADGGIVLSGRAFDRQQAASAWFEKGREGTCKTGRPQAP
jgi:hypothetical protein